MYAPVTFGDYLREWIEAKGLSSQELSRLLGYARDDAIDSILCNQASFSDSRYCLAALDFFGLATQEECHTMEDVLREQTSSLSLPLATYIHKDRSITLDIPYPDYPVSVTVQLLTD